MAFKMSRIARFALVGTITLPALGAAAVDKTPHPPLADRPQRSPMSEERRIELAVRQAERRELVRPAGPDFKPEPVDRKLRLTLIPRDKTIRVGERFWYRIELQNLGREPVRFLDFDSFLKNGALISMRWDFELVDPHGKRIDLVVGTLFGLLAVKDHNLDAVPIPGAEKMSDDEVQDYIRRDSARRRADRRLDVVLAPGETLLSRPWRWHDHFERLERKERGETNLTPMPQGPWRELWVSYPIETPGRYEIQVVYDDTGPTAPHEDILRAKEKRGISRESAIADYQETVKKRLGRLVSEPVRFEVIK